MIGGWDESGCVLAIAPAAWKLGNGSADKTSGNFPTYPSALVAMALQNMGAGYGYDKDTGEIIMDGVNDYGSISPAQQLWGSVKPFSLETIIKPQITPAGFEVTFLFKDFDAAQAFRLMFAGDVATYLGMTITCGANTARYGYGNRATFHNLKQHLVVTYNGLGLGVYGNWKFYIDGSPVALSSYSGATGANNTVNYIGANVGPSSFTECETWWTAVYNKVLSPARVAANYALGDAMGLIGNNVGDLMNLTAPGAAAIIPAGIFEGSH